MHPGNMTVNDFGLLGIVMQFKEYDQGTFNEGGSKILGRQYIFNAKNGEEISSHEGIVAFSLWGSHNNYAIYTYIHSKWQLQIIKKGLIIDNCTPNIKQIIWKPNSDMLALISLEKVEIIEINNKEIDSKFIKRKTKRAAWHPTKNQLWFWENGILLLWNIDIDEIKECIADPTHESIANQKSTPEVTLLSFSPNGRAVALGYNNGIIELYNTETYVKLRSFKTTYHESLNCIRWSPKSSLFLASTLHDKYITIFDAQNNRVIKHIWRFNDHTKFLDLKWFNTNTIQVLENNYCVTTIDLTPFLQLYYRITKISDLKLALLLIAIQNSTKKKIVIDDGIVGVYKKLIREDKSLEKILNSKITKENNIIKTLKKWIY